MDILIVEDNRHLRRMLREIAQHAFPHANIGESGDGATAFFQFAVWRPRVILMDIDLPDANGLTVAGRMKNMMPDVAIVIVSHHQSSIYKEHAQAVGVQGFINKDDIDRQLLPMLASLLSNPNQLGAPC